MEITVSRVIVWLIVGALAGTLTGVLVKRRKEGFGPIINLGVGLVGALIGGSLTYIFNIDLGIGQISISLQDLLTALVGSLLFLFLIWIVQKQRQRQRAGPK
jgi:uncharacterized membrane protein YeaQ/YmgE (transglycosylase-associated protein family)